MEAKRPLPWLERLKLSIFHVDIYPIEASFCQHSPPPIASHHGVGWTKELSSGQFHEVQSGRGTSGMLSQSS